jgi:NAD(P)-dependent dehydrogenase (short-subunit alcohol dehydrogenase family)
MPGPRGINPRSLGGQLAVVTGGASGIGLAIAESCAMHQMSVLLADIEEDALTQAVQSLRRRGADVLGERVDVSDSAQVEHLADLAYARGKPVRLLFNNAGVGVLRSFLESSLEDWRWTLEVNLWGAVHGMRSFLPRMIEAHCDARIVNTASAAGLLSPPDLAAYAVSKHGVVALTESVQIELAQLHSDVRLAVLCPDLIRTRIHEGERNRPQRHRCTQEVVDRTQSLGAAMDEAMSAEEVSRIVFDALERGDFTIFTHEITRQQLRQRIDRVLDGRAPEAHAGNLSAAVSRPDP